MAIWKRLHLLLPHFSLLLLLLLLSLLPLLLFALCCYVFVCWQFTAREMVAQNSLLESFDTGEVIWVDIERFDIYPYVNISLPPTASGDTIVASAFCFDFAVVCAVVVFFWHVSPSARQFIYPEVCGRFRFFFVTSVRFLFFPILLLSTNDCMCGFFGCFRLLSIRVCFVYNTRIYLS